MSASSQHNASNARAHRVIASLNREQIDCIDKIGKDALFSAGVKLSRTHILAAMVNVLKRFALDGEGIRTAEQRRNRPKMGLPRGAGRF